MTRIWAAAAALAALAGCATPEQRVRGALVKAGLAEPVAACMADRMTDRLSLVQLRRLQSLGSIREARAGETGIDAFLHRLRALKDGEILAVVSGSALRCSVGGRLGLK